MHGSLLVKTARGAFAVEGVPAFRVHNAHSHAHKRTHARHKTLPLTQKNFTKRITVRVILSVASTINPYKIKNPAEGFKEKNSSIENLFFFNKQSYK